MYGNYYKRVEIKMKFLLLVCCLLVSTVLSDPECPKNMIYNPCGYACPLTCKTVPPKTCPEKCNIGCECRTGYVRKSKTNSTCVDPREC